MNMLQTLAASALLLASTLAQALEIQPYSAATLSTAQQTGKPGSH